MNPVAQRFSRAARTYERGAGLHQHVAARLVELMPDPVQFGAGAILEVGCGTGILTERLRQRYTLASLCVMDVAEGMVAYVRERWGDDSRMEYVVADVRMYRDDRKFDLIASSSALHWAIPLEETLAGLRSRLKSGGVLCAALMVDGTLGELHALRRQIAPGKTPEGRLPTAGEVLSAFDAAGFEEVASETETIRARYHSADDFLCTIHAQGLTAGNVSRARLPLSRSELVRLREEYEAACSDGHGGVHATFEVLYVRGKG